MELEYKKAEMNDVQMLIDIYNSAFYDDYLKYGECPAYGHTKESMEKNLETFPKIIAFFQNSAVGVVSYQNKGNGEYYIGCLGVKKEHQGQGVGTLLMKKFMAECSDWKMLTLVTPIDKAENIRFYTERFGFKIIGEEKDSSVVVYQFQLNR